MDGVVYRAAYRSEWDICMDLAWRTFLKYEASDYTQEGIDNFKAFVKDDVLKTMFHNGAYQLFVAVYQKKIIGSFIRALCANGAYSEASAKTAEELGQEKNNYALRALKKKSGVLRTLVTSVDGRYYIEGEKNQMRARSQFKPDRSNLFVSLLVAVAMIGVGMAIFLVIPQIIENLKAL